MNIFPKASIIELDMYIKYPKYIPINKYIGVSINVIIIFLRAGRGNRIHHVLRLLLGRQGAHLEHTRVEYLYNNIPI